MNPGGGGGRVAAPYPQEDDMAGSVRVSTRKASPNEMKIKVAHTSPPAHAYGEGGPEKNSGYEGPDTMPGGRGDRKKED